MLLMMTYAELYTTLWSVGVRMRQVLDVAAFERLMGPAMDVMKRNIAYYDDQMAKIFGSTAEDD